MTPSAFDQFANLVAEVLSSEQKHFHTTVAYPFALTSPPLDVDALSKSDDVLSPSTRADFLRRLKELAHQCETVAHKKLDRTSFASVVRALSAVVDAVETLHKWEDYGELDVNRRGGASPIEFQLKERFEKRSAAVRVALVSDVLVELAFLCRTSSNGSTTDTSVGQPETSHATTPTKQKKSKKDSPDWLHDASAEPPREFYRDKWLTGTKTEMGFALRHEKLDSVKSDRALRDYLKNAASGVVPRVWCRATLTDDIQVFLRHCEPRDTEAVLKALHEAETRLSGFGKRKPKEVGGSPRKPLR